MSYKNISYTLSRIFVVLFLRHDMRRYSGLIDSLLEEGEYNEIKKVTEHINTVTDGNKVIKYCNNMVVNTMLSCMKEKAYSLAIEIQQDIIISREIPFDSYEIAMVCPCSFSMQIQCGRPICMQ